MKNSQIIETNGTGYAIAKKEIKRQALDFRPRFLYDIVKDGEIIDRNLNREQAFRIFKNYYTDANLPRPYSAI